MYALTALLVGRGRSISASSSAVIAAAIRCSIIAARRPGWRSARRRSGTRSDELRRQLAIFETARDIDRETYSQVESTLGDLQAQIQAQEEELVFYRGIVSPQDGVAGLRIQSLEVLPSDGERRYLAAVVAGSGNRSQSASVRCRKVATRGRPGRQTASFDVAELVVPRRAYDMAYEFRYFQGLETELALPLGFEPQRVVVEIWPNEARARADQPDASIGPPSAD